LLGRTSSILYFVNINIWEPITVDDWNKKGGDRTIQRDKLVSTSMELEDVGVENCQNPLKSMVVHEDSSQQFKPAK